MEVLTFPSPSRRAPVVELAELIIVPSDTWLTAHCDFAETIVYNRVVADSERVAVENYLADKYNISITTGIEDSREVNIPKQFTLSQNYPNPFNPTTTINYSIPTSEFVTLKAYDVLGKEVAALVNEEKPAGSYKVEFNAGSLYLEYISTNSGQIIIQRS